MKKLLNLLPRLRSLAIVTTVGMFTFALGGVATPRTAIADHCAETGCSSPNADLAFNMEDMNFILDQIKIAERHAAGEELIDILPNATFPFGLRTVDGSYNNVLPGQEKFGKADELFLDATDRAFVDAQNGSYMNSGDLVDSTPRLISHLIVNQSVDNPAAVAAADAEGGVNVGPDIAGADQLFIPNTAPDEGLSSPINAFMTFFGQFFDHGLDLINKGGNGTVMIPLQPDDPLYNPAPGAPNFMMMTRATRVPTPGPDGILGTEDDGFGFINATTPHVDQQQTYSSHSSVQVILRKYEVRDGVLQDTGELLNGPGMDGIFDNADDEGMSTWDTIQNQARTKFGFNLEDKHGLNVPMFVADQYGNVILGTERGLPQIVIESRPGVFSNIEGNLAANGGAGVTIPDTYVGVNQNMFLDIAHTAQPHGDPDSDSAINPRIDTLSGQTTRGVRAAGSDGYDDELLGVHFMCGDGRCNENIALTTVHHIFHHEHNRLAYIAKRVLLDDAIATGSVAILNEWLDAPVANVAATGWGGLTFAVTDASMDHQHQTKAAIDALDLDWNGSRIFQAARFGTEMQYNRIVFDEFSPTLAGLKDVFEGFHPEIDPTITTEFSQTVYRFGHSMLTNTVDRFDENFEPINSEVVQTGEGGISITPNSEQLGLFEAFLNPLEFLNADPNGNPRMSATEGAAAVLRGITRTTANEIDEFVDGSLQNNLVGLPLDLGAINIARGRDVGNPPLNVARRMFFEATQDTRLMPYANWADYADNLRHEETLVNFIAAYGAHPSVAGPDGIVGNVDDPVSTYADRRAAACAIVGALAGDAAAYCAATGFGTPPATPADAMDFLFGHGLWENHPTLGGLELVDFWNGGLAEERMPFGGYLGSTHNFVFETQMEDLQNGDRFYYVGRTANIHFFSELESNSFTALAQRATGVTSGMHLNIFSVPNHILEVDQSQQFNADGEGTSADPGDESEIIQLVIRDAEFLTTNIDVLDATRVLQYTGGDHVVINGTSGSDTLIGGIGDDTLMGGAGDDRIEGGDGADLIEGGPGDDIITDLSGPDVIEGGAGNDAIMSGNEEDVIFGDEGKDFIVNPSELGEIFGGLGDDFILDGVHLGHIRGGGGDDWMENLGGGEDLWQGDDGAAAEGGEPTVLGNDVGIAHGGNNDFDMENGDDIVVDGPGIERVEGQLGFDWISFQNDQFGVDIDLDLTIFLRPQLPPSNNTILNRYDRVEGISGSPMADILRGTENIPGAAGTLGNELQNLTLIEGLVEHTAAGTCATCVVPFGELRPLGNGGFGWENGEIILGGAGSDIMNGEGGDDIIDGDAALQVGLLTPDPAIVAGPLGEALKAAKAAAATAASQHDLDVQAVASYSDLQAALVEARDAAIAARAAAQAAADAAEAAKAGSSTMSITDSFGELVGAAVGGTSLETEWNDFLAACSAALSDLGWDVDSSKVDRVQALQDEIDALDAEIAVDIAAFEAQAAISAAAVPTTASDLAVAQQALDDAMAAAPNGGLIIVAGMRDIMDAVFAGFINPGDIYISRIVSDHDETNAGTDVAVYSGNLADYIINGPDPVTGYYEVIDNRAVALTDGRDLVRNVERLQFSDQTLVLASTGGNGSANSPAEGDPAIIGSTPAGSLLATIGTVTDADNVSTAGVVDAADVAWTWEVELEPGSGEFTTILREGTGDAVEATGDTLVLTPEDLNLLIRVRGIFQDEAGALENIISAPVLNDGSIVGPPPVIPTSLTLDTVNFIARQARLRVTGTVEPAGSSVDLFDGTDNGDGTCNGTLLGTAVADGAGVFSFDIRPTGDPGIVCVQADNGLATDNGGGA